MEAENYFLYLSDIESTFLLISQVVLTTMALVLNVLYLIFIKVNRDRLNATESLQVCKTTLVILTLAICMPLEIIVVHGIRRDSLSACLLKDVMDTLLLYSYPFAIMAVAITRLRVCVCMGNSSVLVTRTSAFFTFALSLLPSLLSGSGLMMLYCIHGVYNFYDGGTVGQDPKVFYECRDTSNNTVKMYQETVLLISGVLPMIVTVTTYAYIYHKVSSSRNRSLSIAPTRNGQGMGSTNCKGISILRNIHDANIKTTMTLLTALFTTSWSVHFVLAMLNLTHPSKFIAVGVILSKSLPFLIHPLAEGLLLQHKRVKLGTFFGSVLCRSTKDSRIENPRMSVQINSSCIRTLSVGQLSSSEQNMLSDSPSPSLKLISIEDDDKNKIIENIENGISTLPCLYTRRTNRPLAPIISIVEDTEVGRSENLEVCALSRHTTRRSTIFREGDCLSRSPCTRMPTSSPCTRMSTSSPCTRMSTSSPCTRMSTSQCHLSHRFPLRPSPSPEPIEVILYPTALNNILKPPMKSCLKSSKSKSLSPTTIQMVSECDNCNTNTQSPNFTGSRNRLHPNSKRPNSSKGAVRVMFSTVHNSECLSPTTNTENKSFSSRGKGSPSHVLFRHF